MIKTCRQCGVPFGAGTNICSVCHPLFSRREEGYRVRNGGLVRSNYAVAAVPDWRSEVSQRLQDYRKRQRRFRDGTTQPELSFGDERATNSRLIRYAPEQEPAVATAPAFPHRVRRAEPIEIDLIQPSLNFSANTTHSNDPEKLWNEGLVSPFASMRERRLAGCFDAVVILAAYGVFLSLFTALGGRFVASRTDAAILLTTLGLFYTQYFTLFTFFGGATPGMTWRGLRIASFEGGDPSAGALAWRSFGYFTSAVTLMLGFFWVLWDEDRLCWHDRISQTHLTWEPQNAPASLTFNEPV